jgi:tRNA threonylcarbamoyladenosine biosynthesis protein TsaB
LAIDCALRRINLGASDGEKLLGELSADVGMRQSELLPSAVENFLSLTGNAVRDVGHIVVTVGPGYYTGIRVGLSYAAALAEGLGATVSGVSTLRAMAIPLVESFAAVGAAAAVAPVIPAGRGSIYAALYDTGGGVLSAPSHIKTDDFMEYLKSSGSKGGIVLVGNDLPDELAGAFICLCPSGVSRGALAAARDEPPCDPASIRAVYLRGPY